MMTTDVGNIMDRGPQEYYISNPCELPVGATVKGIDWEAKVPPKTWVKAQLRFANSREALQEAPWQGPDGADRWFRSGQSATGLRQEGPWVQYRLALGALSGGNSPRVSAVNVHHG